MMLLNPYAFASGSPPPPALPASLNFKTATYTVNGVTKAASDVIDQPTWITTAGLEILETEASPSVGVINDALTAFLADDQTIVIEYYERSDNGESYPFYCGVSDPVYYLNRPNIGHHMNATDTSGIHFRAVTDTAVFTAGVHKIAVSRANAKLVMSVDGGSIVSDSSDTFALTATPFALGAANGASYNSHDIYIRSIACMALQSDGDLPTLSARPTYSLPGSTLASADFLNGVYTVAGSSVTLSAIVDTPAAVGAFGLEMPYGDVPIGIIGAFLATLTSMNWTVLIGYEEDTHDDITIPLAVATNALDAGVTLKRLADADNLNMQARDFNASPASRTITDLHLFKVANLHQIALTRVAGRLSMSADGNPVVTDPSSLTATAEAAAFGGLPGDTTINGGYIRFIHVWAPMSDGALQDLSTVWS